MRAVAAVALALVLTGCLAPATLPAPRDAAAQLPASPYFAAKFDPARGYHTLEEVQARLDALAAERPDLVRIATLGESREHRPIRALVLENRSVPGPKAAPFIDGGHHANEVEGVEITLYLADFLVHNYDANATARALVDGLETWVVPLVNPDGYVRQTRFNAAGVNLNRNYDLDWCSPTARNTCPPGPVNDVLMPLAGPTPENAGTGPFSEPESRALRDGVLALGKRIAFYLSHHTPAHCLAQPWTAPNPPFPIPGEHQAVFDKVFAWVKGHTEYGAGTWDTPGGTCMDYNAGGASQDWAYATARVPSFTMEVAGSKGWEGINPYKAQVMPPPEYDSDLAHWMPATLPIELFFLANAAQLQTWSPELRDPALPAS